MNIELIRKFEHWRRLCNEAEMRHDRVVIRPESLRAFVDLAEVAEIHSECGSDRTDSLKNALAALERS